MLISKPRHRLVHRVNLPIFLILPSLYNRLYRLFNRLNVCRDAVQQLQSLCLKLCHDQKSTPVGPLHPRRFFLLDARALTSPPIGQTFSDNALHGFGHALCIVHAEGFALIIAIIESHVSGLRNIPLPCLCARNIGADIFLDEMIYGSMPGEFLADFGIDWRFIRH
jgi:hypothetical protein